LDRIFNPARGELFRSADRYILEGNAFDETNASGLKSAYAKEET
jgi:hypothetical protein